MTWNFKETQAAQAQAQSDNVSWNYAEAGGALEDAPDSGPVLETVIFANGGLISEGTKETLLDAMRFRLEGETILPKDRIEALRANSLHVAKVAAEKPGAGYPDGNPKTAAGAKKPDLTVIPPTALLHLSLAMMNGEQKYGLYNWRELAISSRPYVAAALRHLLAFLDGEDFSQDTVATGKPVHHLAHVMATCAIVLDAMELGVLNDNRGAPGKAGDMVEHYNLHGVFQ